VNQSEATLENYSGTVACTCTCTYGGNLAGYIIYGPTFTAHFIARILLYSPSLEVNNKL